MPDLTRITAARDGRSCSSEVVHDGALKPRGMASFAAFMNEQEVEDIRAFLLGEAKKAQTAN